MDTTKTGGGLAVLLTLGALVVVLALLASHAYGASTATDYCRDIRRAEALTCRAEYQAALADCAWTLALDRWLGLESANADAVACKQDAAEELSACRAEIFCEVTQ